MSEVDILRSLLKIAVDELRRHNECYHASTPPVVLQGLEEAVETRGTDVLEEILRTVEESVAQRSFTPR